jgi:O-antigen/teichoic acid export membrane protein
VEEASDRDDSPGRTVQNLTDTPFRRGKQLAMNLASLGAPLLGAVIAIPVLLSHMSAPAFSLLAIYWVIIGYANVFELGMGRSVARELSRSDPHDVEHQADVIGAGLITGTMLGILAGIIGLLALPLLLGRIISIPPELAAANSQSIVWVAVCIPALVITSVLGGALEAWQQFGKIALIRIPSGLALFLVPAVFSLAGYGLDTLLLGIVAVRLVLVVIMAWTIEAKIRGSVVRPRWNRTVFLALVSFGGWLTVSALLGPLLVFLDRFILSWAHGLAATAIYTPPFEAVIRFLVIPSAVVGVMFPRFVGAAATGGPGEKRLVREAYLYLAILVIPVSAAFVVFGDLIFSLWLGPSGVDARGLELTAQLANILSIGLLINAMAHIPQAHIQAHGLSRWTALLHISELIGFFIYAPILIVQFGLFGAAWSWVLRATLSAAVLCLLSLKLVNRGINNDSARHA